MRAVQFRPPKLENDPADRTGCTVRTGRKEAGCAGVFVELSCDTRVAK